MAEPLGMAYRATQPITDPDTGARAYNTGDLVHESALEDGGGRLGVRLGVNVERRDHVAVSRPAKNAPAALWVEFAVAEGMDRADAEGMSRKDLIKLYGEADDQAAAPVVTPAETPAGDEGDGNAVTG
jgi:hypothetical protein